MDGHQPPAGIVGRGPAQPLERLAPHEVDRLPARDREPEASRERIVERPDVVAPRPEPALQPRRLEGERSRLAQPEVGAGGQDVLMEVGHEFGRHGQLPAELPGERDAERPRTRPRNVDLAGPQERPNVGRRGRHP